MARLLWDLRAWRQVKNISSRTRRGRKNQKRTVDGGIKPVTRASNNFFFGVILSFFWFVCCLFECKTSPGSCRRRESLFLFTRHFWRIYRKRFLFLCSSCFLLFLFLCSGCCCWLMEWAEHNSRQMTYSRIVCLSSFLVWHIFSCLPHKKKKKCVALSFSFPSVIHSGG